MKQLYDQEFDRWLKAIERGEKDLPSSLPPDDAADLRLAQRLFALRSPVSRPVFPDVARSQIYAAIQERRRIWRLAMAALLVLLLLAAAISSSGTARAEILKTLGLADEERSLSPIPVIFEGERYEPAALQLLFDEQLQDVELVLVLDGDENGFPIFRAFRSPEEARSFLDERQGAPPGDERSEANK